MSDSLVLTVPLDPRFRGLATELTAKHAELAGGTAAEAQAVAASVADALTAIAQQAGDDGSADVTFGLAASGIEIHIQSGDRRSVIRQPLAVPKS